MPAEQLNHAIEGCASRQKILILDCCYSGAFPAGRAVKADDEVHAAQRFSGRGRSVLTAADSTQYAFEGDRLISTTCGGGGPDSPDRSGVGAGGVSVFTRHLVEGLRSGEADLDGDGDITIDELYSYVHDRVVAEKPQQRPKKQTDVEGRTVLARNVNWTLPGYLGNSLDSPIATDRLGALDGLVHLCRIGNDTVRAHALARIEQLTTDDSRAVSAAATTRLNTLRHLAEQLAYQPTDTATATATPSLEPLSSAARERAAPQLPASPAEPVQALGVPVAGLVAWLLAICIAVVGIVSTVAGDKPHQQAFAGAFVGVVGVGLICCGFERRRNRVWWLAVTANLTWLLGTSITVFASLDKAVGYLLVLGAPLNLAVSIIAIRGRRTSQLVHWWLLAGWTATLVGVICLIAYDGGSSEGISYRVVLGLLCAVAAVTATRIRLTALTGRDSR